MKNNNNNKQYIVCEIENTMTSLENLSKGNNTFRRMYDDNNDYILWERTLTLTSIRQEKYIYVLPKNDKLDQDSLGKLLQDKKNIGKEIFIIDVYDKCRGANNIVTANELYKILFNIDCYQKYMASDIEMTRISDLYITRHYNVLRSNIDYESKKTDIQCTFSDWALENSSYKRPILLLGDRGIGKSWVVKKFCLNQIILSISNPWVYPPAIYINLSYLSDKFSKQASLLDIIMFHLKSIYQIEILDDYYVWEAFLRTNRIILVLDGFDEMTKEINQEIMYKNLWEIFSIINKSSKVILTARTNHFDSKNKIYEHFSYIDYMESSRDTMNDEQEFSEIGTRIRKNFNIYELKEFEKTDFRDLLIKYGLQNNLVYIEGSRRLNKIKKNATPWNLEYEIDEITSIPAISDALVKILGHSSINLITAYRTVIMSAIIEYNIDINRAVNNLITVSNQTLKTWDLSANTKIKILSEIAWYMYERDYEYFMFERIPYYIKNRYGLNYEITVNDLRTQTVIRLYEDNKYAFVTSGIYAFLVASYIYELLLDENGYSNKKGIECIGRYDLSKNEIGRRTCTFLTDLIEKSIGMKHKISKLAKDIIDKSEPYVVWQKYLIKNLQSIDINLVEVKVDNHWSGTSIISNENMVLIANKSMFKVNSLIKPFFISINEVTNKVFEEFLLTSPEPTSKKEYKCLIKNINTEYPGFFWKRKTDIKINSSINKKNISKSWGKKVNPFGSIINDYHLMLWVDGNPPKNKKDHPVVYVSWFAAAYFCNWLSVRHKLPPYYKFNVNLENGKIVVEKNQTSYGYRLPFSSEWKYVAQEGNEKLKYPWDKYKKDNNSGNNSDYLIDDVEKCRQNLLKEQPETYPVRSDEQNLFGVTGMYGNVREWVDRSKVQSVESKKDICFIKGATWLLGETGFEYDAVNSVFAENTNLDVGFRIARSLSEAEMKIVMSAIK